VGAACPDGAFPAVEDGEGTLFVLTGGTGTGTRADPLGSIDDALAVDGVRRVVLGRGTYRMLSAGFELDGMGALEFVGACASETEIVGSFVPSGGQVRIVNTTVRGAVVAQGEARNRIDVSGGVVRGSVQVGFGGAVVLTDAVVESDGEVPISVTGGGALTADGTIMVGGLGGILVVNGAERPNIVTIRDSVLRDGKTYDADEIAGRCVDASGAGNVIVLRNSAIESCEGAGMVSFDAEVSLDHVLIRDVRTAFGGLEGRGLALEGGHAFLHAVHVVGAQEAGISILGGEAVLSDISVEDVDGSGATRGELGIGIVFG
jgi:hypothetical protein